MNDPSRCRHNDTVPVDVGTPALGDVETVARLCVACLAELPAAWGCEDCEWADELRRLCDPANAAPRLLLVRACQEHA